jgi:Uncharacterized protein conserved in bacteria (DUF2064)
LAYSVGVRLPRALRPGVVVIVFPSRQRRASLRKRSKQRLIEEFVAPIASAAVAAPTVLRPVPPALEAFSPCASAVAIPTRACNEVAWPASSFATASIKARPARSPTLPPRLLVQAVGILREPGDRMVLGPASDGGYHLIGLKQAHQHVFTDIPWGTATVARSTCDRADDIGLATTLLPEWYDVDDIETLRWLQKELAGHSTRFCDGGFAPASRAFLKAAPRINQ